METKIYRVSPSRPALWKMRACAKILRENGLVAFPTETVYGLGAIAYSAEAVKRIFAVKGRPCDNPVIVHIAQIEQVYDVVSAFPDEAKALTARYWPGPLTLILPKHRNIPYAVTANLDTVAVRMPAHNVARKLIEMAGPVAAPSANLSGKPSPTRAADVIADLNGKIEAIIDGGKTRIGLESTVILMAHPPVLLRPGAITPEMIEAVVGKIDIHPVARAEIELDHALAPGMKYRHYAPEAKLVLIEPGAVHKIDEVVEQYRKAGAKTAVIRNTGSKAEFARNLFSALRDYDRMGYDVVVVEGTDEEGLGLAIMNRLRKAASVILK